MTMKKIFLAALTGTALLAAAPVFADNGRGGRHDFRSNHFQKRVVYVQHRPHYAPRPVYVQRPVVVYRERSSHDVLGGLIVGAVLGAVIANHAGY